MRLLKLSLFAFLYSTATLASTTLTYSGEFTLAPDTQYNNEKVGGLSALAWDNKNSILYAINDSRNNTKEGFSSLYKFKVHLPDKSSPFRVELLNAKHMTGKDKRDFETSTIDAEGLALTPDGESLLWSSELGSPLRLSNKDGELLKDYSALFAPKFNIAGGKDAVTGVHNANSWEGLSFTPDGKNVYLALEGSLRQDGPLASPLNSGSSRILQFSSNATGNNLIPNAEYLYMTDPVPQVSQFGVNDNGVSEILAINDKKMLVIERSGRNISEGFNDWDFNVRVYLADISKATDIGKIDSLSSYKNTATIQTITKKMIIDFTEYTTQPDCIEGVTFGPLINGKKSLIFVTDNNFQKHQNTKFYLFIDKGGLLD